ncbi:MAG: two-component regulator propeller domain-containing protein, partial [Bacteroidota bacterium]
MLIYNVPNKIGNDKIIDIDGDDSGKIWFITSIRVLLRFDGKNFKTVIPNAAFKGFILSVQAGEGSTFWLGSTRGLLKFDTDQPEIINDLYDSLKGIFIKSAIVKDNEPIWVLSASGVFKNDSESLQHFGGEEGLTGTDVNVLFLDRAGTMWIGTNGKGVYKLANEIFLKYHADQGLSDHAITSVVQDKEGDYWFSTYGNGVDKLVGQKFINYGLEEGLPNLYISSSSVDKSGNLWFGTRNSGLIKYDGEIFQTYDISDGLINNSIRTLFMDSYDRLWIGTISGLSLYVDDGFVNFNKDNGLHDNIIWSLSESEDRKVIIVTREGINYYVDNKMHKGISDSDIFSKKVNVGLEDSNGNYWIGYFGHGLIKVAPDLNVRSMVTVDDGLTSDIIYNLMLDNDGNLLVGSERGLDKLYLNELGELERIKNYDRVDGFDGIKTLHNSMYKDNNGDVWFGSAEGVFKYQLSKEEANYTEPITYISGLKLFYNEVDWSEYSDSTSLWFNLPVSLALPYNSNSLVLEYFGASLKNPEKVNYQFRLLGLESNWSPVTSRSEAVYTNLSPGDYTFEVRASNSAEGVFKYQLSKEEANYTEPITYISG